MGQLACQSARRAGAPAQAAASQGWLPASRAPGAARVGGLIALRGCRRHDHACRRAAPPKGSSRRQLRRRCAGSPSCRRWNTRALPPLRPAAGPRPARTRLRPEAFAQGYANRADAPGRRHEDGPYERVLRYPNGTERRIRYPPPPPVDPRSEDLTDGCWADSCWEPRAQWLGLAAAGGSASSCDVQARAAAAAAPPPPQQAPAPGSFLPQQPPPAEVRGRWCNRACCGEHGNLHRMARLRRATRRRAMRARPRTPVDPLPPRSRSARSCRPPQWSCCATSTLRSTSAARSSCGRACAAATRCAGPGAKTKPHVN